MDKGILAYQAINVEEPGNRHFIRDFGLYTKSIVVVEREGERVKRFKVLSGAWPVARDAVKLKNYIRNQVRAFMEGR